MSDEPIITVNGHRLTRAQAMAVRVAVSGFFADMCERDALGEDATGRAIAEGYRDRLREVLAIAGIGGAR